MKKTQKIKMKKTFIVAIALIVIISLGKLFDERYRYQYSAIFYKWGSALRLFNDQKIYINTSSNNALSLKKNSKIYINFKNFDKSEVELSIFKVSMNNAYLSDLHPSKYHRYISEFSKDKKCNVIKFDQNDHFVKNYKIEKLLGPDCYNGSSNEAFIYYGEIKIINNLSKKEIFWSNFYQELLSLTKRYHKFSNHGHKKLVEKEIYTFYFNLEKKTLSKNSKTLFILPAITFFNYFSSESVNNFTTGIRSNNDYFFQPTNTIPIHKNTYITADPKLLQKNKMIYSIYSKYKGDMNVIYDFDLTDKMILDHDVIVFPWHLQYYDKKYSLQNILHKLKDSNKEKIIISHSPSNFQREVNLFKDQFNDLYGIEFTHSRVANQLVLSRKICNFNEEFNLTKRVSNMEGFTLLEKKNDQINWDSDSHYFNFKCDGKDNILYPLINKKKKNNIIFVEFNNASTGRIILHSSILKNFFSEVLKVN